MRIIAGLLGGRTFDSPHGHRTHPMSEKIRGAIFNVLGDIEGMTLFDAFAGSGALAFEAISRGAKSAVATDVTKEAHETMKRNVLALDIEKQVKVVRANVSGWSDNNPRAVFDIVIADPPYDDIQIAILEKLAKHVKRNGLYVLSLPPGNSPHLPKMTQLLVKDYGDAQLQIYRNMLS